MSVYTPFITMAIRLVNKWGMDVTVSSPVNGTPVVPGQAWKPTYSAPVDTVVRMVFFPEETINFYSKFHSLIEKEDYQVGYEYYIMGSTGFIPELNQVVTKPNSEKWRIKYAKEYSPAGEIVLWIVGLKK